VCYLLGSAFLVVGVSAYAERENETKLEQALRRHPLFSYATLCLFAGGLLLLSIPLSYSLLRGGGVLRLSLALLPSVFIAVSRLHLVEVGVGLVVMGVFFALLVAFSGEWERYITEERIKARMKMRQKQEEKEREKYRHRARPPPPHSKRGGSKEVRDERRGEGACVHPAQAGAECKESNEEEEKEGEGKRNGMHISDVRGDNGEEGRKRDEVDEVEIASVKRQWIDESSFHHASNSGDSATYTVEDRAQTGNISEGSAVTTAGPTTRSGGCKLKSRPRRH